jgi:hypothetical protein
MKAFVVIVLIGVGVYLLYLATQVQWANFAPLCLADGLCFDAYAAGGGLIMMLFAAIAWKVD